MKKSTFLLASLLIMAGTMFVVSCNGKTPTAQNSTEPSTSKVSSQLDIGTNKLLEGELPICNTKWKFYFKPTDKTEVYDMTDSYTIFDIKGMARDGVSAKVEIKMVFIDKIGGTRSEKLYCGTVKAAYSDESKVFLGYSFSDIPTWCFDLGRYDGSPYYRDVLWDYENGYLYIDKDAYMSENPNDRVPIKRVE